MVALEQYLELETELRMLEACIEEESTDELVAARNYVGEQLQKLQESMVPEELYTEDDFRDDILEWMNT